MLLYLQSLDSNFGHKYTEWKESCIKYFETCLLRPDFTQCLYVLTCNLKIYSWNLSLTSLWLNNEPNWHFWHRKVKGHCKNTFPQSAQIHTNMLQDQIAIYIQEVKSQHGRDIMSFHKSTPNSAQSLWVQAKIYVFPALSLKLETKEGGKQSLERLLGGLSCHVAQLSLMQPRQWMLWI